MSWKVGKCLVLMKTSGGTYYKHKHTPTRFHIRAHRVVTPFCSPLKIKADGNLISSRGKTTYKSLNFE